jgi:hypothetical protein
VRVGVKLGKAVEATMQVAPNWQGDRQGGGIRLCHLRAKLGDGESKQAR